MVRTKYTPPRVKLVLPDVTEEMIKNYKRRGRPLRDKSFELQLIKAAIIEDLLEKRNEACEQRMAERRRALEEQERLEREAREREQLERAEKEREARERAELEEQERERARCEQAHLERERLAQEWAEQERSAREQIERDRAREARLQRKLAERERVRRESLERARLNVKREAQARLETNMARHMRLERERIAARQLEIDRLGEEEYYRQLRARLREKELRDIADQLAIERAQTKKLLTKPDIMFEQRKASLEYQLYHPDMIEFRNRCNKCPRIRERNRGSAIEMQRMVELYDMIAEDWELDEFARGETAENRVTTTTPPCDDNEPRSLAAIAPPNEPKYWQYYTDKVNDMDNPDYHTLMARFGSKPYYRWMFTGRDTHDPIKTYQQLDRAKGRHETEYEVARQKYLQILAFHAKYWYRTSPLTDKSVEISRLHRDDLKEYLGFMRIRCGGHRGEKSTPPKMQIVFHLLLGRASFSINKRPRIMSRGSHVLVEPGSTFSINCLGRNQAAYFVFHISFTSYPDQPALFKSYFGLNADP